MNLEEEVLDNPEIEKQSEAKFKSRTPSDLMIVIGIVHMLIGSYGIYAFFEILISSFNLTRLVGADVSSGAFMNLLIRQSLPFLFGITLIIGGIGLIRHKMLGWKFALASSVFAISLPILKFALNLYMPQIEWSVSGVFPFLFLLVFGLSFIFLISKTIRGFYLPKTKDYIFTGIIVALLSLNFLLTPLLF